jgi:hypothetical protein
LQGPSTALDPRDIEAIRRRLVAIRKVVCGDNQAAFARHLRITAPRWHNLENGYPVSIGIVMALMRSVEGMTSSYILEGQTERMPKKLVHQLSEFDPSLLDGSSKPPSRKT